MMDYEALLLIPGPFVAVLMCAFFFWMCAKHVESVAPRDVLPISMHPDGFPADELMAKKRAALFSYKVVMNPSGSFFLGAARVGSVESSPPSRTSERSRPKNETDGGGDVGSLEGESAPENFEQEPCEESAEETQVLEAVSVAADNEGSNQGESV